MGTTAEFQRIGLLVRALARTGLAAHRDNPHLVAILLAKERLRPHLARVIRGHDPGFHGGVLADVAVHLFLDRGQLVGRHGVVVAIIKPQTIRRIQRATLHHVIPQGLAQRLVQQVCGRVVRSDRGPPRVVHIQDRSLRGLDCALCHLADMDEDTRGLARVGHRDHATVGLDRAGVPDLTATFGVKRCLVQRDLNGIALFHLGHLRPVLDQRNDLPLGSFGVIAQKIGGAGFFSHIEPNGRIGRFARTGPCGTRLGLLRIHRGVEAFKVNLAVLFAQGILGQIDREAVGVIEFERGLARQIGTGGQALEFVIQQLQTAVQRLFEARFFQQQCLCNQ